MKKLGVLSKIKHGDENPERSKVEFIKKYSVPKKFEPSLKKKT